MTHRLRAAGLVLALLVLPLLFSAPATRTAEAQVPNPRVPATLTAFQDTVALVATPELISAAANAPTGYVRQIAITPLSTNTGTVEIRTTSANAGYQMLVGGAITIPIQSTLAASGVLIRVSVAGEGYTAIAWTDTQ